MKAHSLWICLALAFSATAAPQQIDRQHFQWQRPVVLAPGAKGQTCAVLDGDVYGHAASGALNDLRLYVSNPASAVAREVPYALPESNTHDVEEEFAPAEKVSAKANVITFDLHMPERPYTTVDLNLGAQDFTGEASVTDSDGKLLGSFPIFDLTGQHLSRSTSLPLQESVSPWLHVRLQVQAAAASPDHPWNASVVRGARVPPSRSAQIRYTSVAQTTAWQQLGRTSVAGVVIPAHAPVTRVRFSLPQDFRTDFLRRVTLTATPLPGTGDVHETADANGPDSEFLTGQIAQVHRVVKVAGKPLTIEAPELTVDAVLAANLRSPARVLLSVDNGGEAPLPLAAATLEMRERRLCFEPVSSPDAQGAVYTLMYGDPDLPPPHYSYSDAFVPAAKAATAVIGPAQANAGFAPLVQPLSYRARHPHLLWTGIFAALVAFGGIALGGMRQQRAGSR